MLLRKGLVEIMQEKKISIISIIYKVEPYLRQCIESIVNQTYKNLEIILVAGEGDEGCYKICKEFADQDSRIKLVTCKPAGVSDARNHGLEVMTGDYLGFVDGDDFIEPDMYETLVKNLEGHACDIAVCGRFYEFMNVSEKDEARPPVILNPSQALDMILSGTGFFLHCWDKLFTRKVFEGLSFPVDKHVEDRIVVNRLIDKADRIVYDSTPKYHFRERADSLSKEEKMTKMNTIANEELAAYIFRVHPELRDVCESFMIYEHITCIQNLMLKGSRDKEQIALHKDFLRGVAPHLKQNARISKKVRLKLWLVTYCPHLLLMFTRSHVKKQNDEHVRFKL